ncbi:hypothetical protein ElyMa_002669800 [Elysia marginata]|uniref:Uncharacterized protein n=1 Tax=Elysia marginata TaxID=1093978 RepID=A0AAV4HBQ9_9GAST|nr:hypothetical protein ElyMa_002669800 [Elysia marginata]
MQDHIEESLPLALVDLFCRLSTGWVGLESGWRRPGDGGAPGYITPNLFTNSPSPNRIKVYALLKRAANPHNNAQENRILIVSYYWFRGKPPIRSNL